LASNYDRDRVLDSQRLRFNFLLTCTHPGGCNGWQPQTRSNAWLESSDGKRYPLVEGAGSILEREATFGRNNDTREGYLVFPSPDPPQVPVQLYYDGYKAFAPLRLL
jgi:hypothetical protein